METVDLGGTAWRPGARTLIVAVVVAGLVVAAVVWSRRPEPMPDFTRVAVTDVYAGMVVGDDIFQWSPRSAREDRPSPAGQVRPSDCVVLFDTTVFGAAPHGALDGAQTYYSSSIGGRAIPIALMTWRYADEAGAHRAYETIARAATACTTDALTLHGETATLAVAPGGSPAADAPALAYTFDTPGARYAVHVMRYANTLTWQFRLLGEPTGYDPLPATQLLSSLYQQLVAVRSALPR